MKQDSTKKYPVWLIILFWFLIWQAVAMIIDRELIFPSPITTLTRLFVLMTEAIFWRSAFMTLLRITSGFFFALVMGVILAFVCSASPFAAALLGPIRLVVKATPVTSFILLVILWLAAGAVPVFISFLMVLPIIWTNVESGIRQTDPLLLEMAEVFEFSFIKKLKYIYIPSVLPSFKAACATGIGFAWKAGAAAEVLAMSPISIGRNLYESKLYLETADLFAWTLFIIILSLAAEKLLSLLLKRVSGERRSF